MSIEEIIKLALKHYGEEKQLRQTQEECAELTVAISHKLRGRVQGHQLTGEIADVLIMCWQLAELVGSENVEAAIHEKLARLESRIKQESAMLEDEK